jgi:hypothetical protein
MLTNFDLPSSVDFLLIWQGKNQRFADMAGKKSIFFM